MTRADACETDRPNGPGRIAEGSGVAIFEEPTRLIFVRYADESSFVIAFFLGLVTLLGLGFLPRHIAGSPPPFDPLLLYGTAALSGSLFLLVLRHILATRRCAASLPPLAVIDLTARQLCDGSGMPLAPLDEVSFSKEIQLFSSDPKLVVRYGSDRKQKIVLARGNPFGGGISRLVRALRSRSLMR